MMLVLKGIFGASPIGFMAAVGLLRVLVEDRGFAVRLGWRNGLAYLEGINEESLLEALADHMENRYQAYEWNWAPSARRMLPDEYARACRQAAGDRRALAFLAAFATDSVLTDDGFIRPSRLDFTSGQQKFIQGLRAIAHELQERHEALTALSDALFGGEYKEVKFRLGWDPVSVRQHAHEATAPGGSKSPGLLGLNWLAIEALPLHPVLPVRNRAITTGCERIGDGRHAYFWPVWEEGLLELPEVRFLRALDFNSLLRRPGVSAVWASNFGSSGKYGMLLPARRIT